MTNKINKVTITTGTATTTQPTTSGTGTVTRTYKSMSNISYPK